jgi:pimeloyl-ACP methyl ester carboxylesterase
MPLTLSRSDLAIHQLGLGGDAPTLVLLHGLTDSGACWPDAVRRWAGGYRIIAVDARGHGVSPRFTPEQLAAHPGEVMLADTVALLEDLAAAGVDRPVVVGHSMGGAMTGAAAALRPDLVRAVVLEDPAWGDPSRQDDHLERGAERVEWTQGFRDDLDGELATGRLENPTWPEAELRPWARSKTQTDPPFLATGIAWPSTPWPELARRLQVPTLVVTGDQEVIVADVVKGMLADIANPLISVVGITGAGHCVRRDAPEAFHAVVDPWVARQFG